MRHALNMAKFTKGGFLRSAIDERQQLINKPPAEVREVRQLGIESPGNRMVKTEMERHLAMLRQNHIAAFLWQNRTTENPQTGWRCKGGGAPPSARHSQLTQNQCHICPKCLLQPPVSMRDLKFPKLTICHPDMCIHSTPLHNTHLSNLDAYIHYSQHDTDFTPDMLTDDGISTG